MILLYINLFFFDREKFLSKDIFLVNLCTEYFFHLDVYAVWAL